MGEISDLQKRYGSWYLSNPATGKLIFLNNGALPIAIDDPVKDEGIIRERLLDELCKR